MIVSVFIGGVVVGVLASIPPGPTWIMCLQRNLSKGFRSGLYSGLGSALCDTLYSLVALFSLSFITSLIEGNIEVVKVVAGSVISFFGINILLKRPEVQLRRGRSGESGGGWKDTATTFLMVLSNPTFILAHITFIATVRSLGLGSVEPSFGNNLLMIAGVFAGCMLWWTTLALVVRLVRRRFRPVHILWVNRLAGSAIVLLGLWLIFEALVALL